MKIGILDFSKVLEGYGYRSSQKKETKLLKEAIEKAGHECLMINPNEYQLYFHGRKYEVFERNEKFEGCDVIIPRVGLIYGLDLEVSIIKQFQLNKVPVINRYMPILNAKNKLRTMQILSKKGIPVVKTVVVRKFDYLDAAIDAIGGYPVILKTPFGTFGSGVVIVESRRSLHSALGMLLDSIQSNVLMIQEYVLEAKGVDYRALVVGDEVVAAMKRTAKKGEFRSNLNLGGKATAVELTDKEKKMAVKAVKALRLEIGGVDILRTDKGPLVMEVNANPGFRGLMKVTKVDVPGKIVDFAVSYVEKKRAKKK
ncbi:MAG: RimK family alpha-L-glutamate ligase [Candidatus Gracilibacteria bacterium]|nr:RimK family alpha-L-glutamate ligase [Candidatus Peregrinibacteria bacterium]